MKTVVLIENTAPEGSCLASEHGLSFMWSTGEGDPAGRGRLGRVCRQRRRPGGGPGTGGHGGAVPRTL